MLTKRGYTPSCFTLLYSRNQHNVVKQLNSNKKNVCNTWRKKGRSSPFCPILSIWQPPIHIASLWTYLLWKFLRNGIIKYVTFWLGLIHLTYFLDSAMLLHVLYTFISSHGWMISHCMYTAYLSIYTYTCYGHLGCSFCLAVMRSAAMNICVCVFVWIHVFNLFSWEWNWWTIWQFYV